jgi:hypothetical protein
MLVLTYHTTWYHVPENLTLNNKALEELQPAKKETGKLLSTAKFHGSKKNCNELTAMCFCKFYVYSDGHEVNFTLRKRSITRKETFASECSLEQIQPYKTLQNSYEYVSHLEWFNFRAFSIAPPFQEKFR